ncbi:MAG: methyltransferase domain-containing protein, partial [Rhodopseudomonas sp.]|nr:methyltransferase domain-containing protein [Rhodopseudomonas sp.]
RITGDVFIDWLAVPQGLRCIDVGCGNGVFTDLLMERCALAEVHGVDPAPAQLEYARQRAAGRPMHFHQGDASSLPFPDRHFDLATMALVIFFVPQPAKGVAEMARVVKPGGVVASYTWDVFGGGAPMEEIRAQMREMGIPPINPPSVDASRMEALVELWRGAGLTDIETKEITVHRRFSDFEEMWAISTQSATNAPVLAKLSATEVARMKEGVRARIPVGTDGSVRPSGRANAIKGRVAA